jgi:hypothetical protein
MFGPEELSQPIGALPPPVRLRFSALFEDIQLFEYISAEPSIVGKRISI